MTRWTETSATSVDKAGEDEPASTRQEEWRSFVFFTVVMAPVIAVIVVAGYGFLVWMYQLVAGPPQA